MSDLLID